MHVGAGEGGRGEGMVEGGSGLMFWCCSKLLGKPSSRFPTPKAALSWSMPVPVSVPSFQVSCADNAAGIDTAARCMSIFPEETALSLCC